MSGQAAARRPNPDWPAAPRRVVVTGMGMLTALGNDVASTWEGMVAGRSGVATITLFDPERLDCRIAGEVKDFDASGVLDKKDMRRFDRYIQFGLVAARQALDHAGLPARFEGPEAERTGVIFGTGLGGVGTLVDGISINALRGPDRISPFFIPMGIPNVGAGQIAISFGMTGPNFTTVSACATGGHAIGEAFETIRRGDAETMVAGGSEAGIREPLVGGFDSMHALSRRNDDPEGASRPFDQGRDGFVPGEGAGAVVLEELEHARARGAPIFAELIGYGATADASHITLPAPGGIGAVRAAERALRKAGLEPRDIVHVNAHATSTPEGDKAELQAIRTIFGDDAGSVTVTSNKSMIGHTLGAAGAIEAIITIQTIRESCVPPTINLVDPDPVGEGLDLVSGAARSQDVPIALSNSFGFGGQNTALILRRWTE
jgi:3-oxoacyl-[acyl-carrier-protein] synthase II